MKKKVLLLAIWAAGFSVYANNIAVSNVSITGRVLGSHTFIRFDLSWDNSFRLASTTAPANWDAAWVFVKYQVTGGTGCTASTEWRHVTLNATGHTGPTQATIDGVSDTRGVFIYRSAAGSGSNSFSNIQIRWNYIADGLLDACTVTIKVFAIEMVYAPTSSFYLGDPGTTGSGKFEAAPYGANNVFQVTSATTPSILGGGAAGSLGNRNTAGQAVTDDFNNTTSKTLPATYPNGFNAFYCMKYELGQEQYVEFLNTLTGTQQTARAGSTTLGRFHPNNTTTPQNRCGIKCVLAPVGATPGRYACDLNNNGVENETTADGLNLALNYVAASDLMAYLDWSGLRPLSEFEYEKACRGELLPVANELATGVSTYTTVTTVSNSGALNEVANTPAGANINASNALTPIVSPVRAGMFATATSTRESAGASRYGIMELSGNVWELLVTVGNAAGRSYTDNHGNGTLLASGAADMSSWPGMNGNVSITTSNAVAPTTGNTGFAGMMFVGGAYYSYSTNDANWLIVSDRGYAGGGWAGVNSRDLRSGGRGVRTAP